MHAKDFLNPTSMLTPGIAGGMTVSITLPLVTQFDMSFRWVALGVSFMLAVIIILSFKQPMHTFQRCLFCILNALIIFSVSVGTGVSIDPVPKAPGDPETVLENTVNKLNSETNVAEQVVLTILGISSAKADDLYERRLKAERELDRETGHDKKATVSAQEKSKTKDAYAQDLRQYQEDMKRYNKRWSW